MYSPLPILVGGFITQSAIPYKTLGRYVAWLRGLLSLANGYVDCAAAFTTRDIELDVTGSSTISPSGPL